MIAKLICSRHKPGQQTIIPDEFIAEIFRSTRILSIRNLGGKLGHALMNAFSIEVNCYLIFFLKYGVLNVYVIFVCV